jgi:hypothetical protein
MKRNEFANNKLNYPILVIIELATKDGNAVASVQCTSLPLPEELSVLNLSKII